MSTTPEVGIRIDAQRFDRWQEVEIRRSVDGFTTVSFDAPFEPERPEFRRTFRPFSFAPIEVYVDEELLFRGPLVSVDPEQEPEERKLRVEAYSTPASLADVTMPIEAFPLELNGLTLRQIAERLVQPFGIELVMDGPDGGAFRRVAIKPDEDPLQFLSDLARKRGMVVSDTPGGALRLLRSAAPGRPVVRLREGAPPLISVRAAFQPQAYWSEMTGLRSTRAGAQGTRHTVQNERLRTPLRPHTFAVDDLDRGDVPAAVRANLGRMFGNMVAYTLELPTWRGPRGQLWQPNTTLTLDAPGAMVYRETELLVRRVTLRQDAESTTATLEVVFPGAFSGQAPEVFPWE